jgi:phosphatidylserine/phosphatidylglycerophosphate/cardiolipin synthase-like enzyme
MLQTIVGKQFPKIVTPLIESARRTLDIVVYDWRWYPQDPGATAQLFNQAVVRAAHRGVQIRVIANNDDIVRTLKSVGCNAKRLPTRGLVHAKLMIIDSSSFVTGSHNYSQHAFTENVELSLVGDDPVVAGELVSFFESLFSLIH